MPGREVVTDGQDLHVVLAPSTWQSRLLGGEDRIGLDDVSRSAVNQRPGALHVGVVGTQRSAGDGAGTTVGSASTATRSVSGAVEEAKPRGGPDALPSRARALE